MTEYEAYQEHIRYTHDTYCRIVIRHASFDAARMLAARWKREISLSSIMGKGGSTFCCRPLITHQQGQSGLSTVGVAHLLAIDWLGWVCYKLHSLWINRTPKNNPCAYEVTNQ